MKKILLISSAIIVSGLGFGQEGPYVSLKGGMAFASSKNTIGTKNVTTSSGDFINTNIYGTFANGINITFNGGFKNSQHFGFDLGVNYLLGNKSIIGEVESPVSEGQTTIQNTLLRIMPGVTFSTDNSALTLYSRIGLVLPVFSNSVREQTLTSSGTTTFQKTEGTGAFSIGYFGAIGVSVKVADNLKIFGEAEAINLQIKQKTDVLTEYTVDGADQLGGFYTQDKETEYVDEVTSSDNTDLNKPRKILAGMLNYNSLGFNIGIRFNF